MTFIAAQFWSLRNNKYYKTHRNFKLYVYMYEWIRDRLVITYYLSRVDHVRKIRDRKQGNDIGNYSFVNRTTKNWNQLPAEALRSSLVHLKFLQTE